MYRACRNVARVDAVAASALLGTSLATFLAACGGSNPSPARSVDITSDNEAVRMAYSPTCSADHPDPAAEIVALVQSIRVTAVEGEFVVAGGDPMQLRIDEHDLLICMIGSESAFFRGSGEPPVAAQALAQGALLRLRTEGWYPEPYDHGDPVQNSAGAEWIHVADTGHTAAAWSQSARNRVSESFPKLRIDNPVCAKVAETVWPAVGRPPLLATGARPADVDPGGVNEIDVEERKVVTAAVAAVTDALQRGLVGGLGHGVGLRGGSFSLAWGPQLTLTLVYCAFTADVKVSGIVTWAHSDIFGAGGFLPANRPLTADLIVSGPGTAGGALHIAGSWLSNDPNRYFSVTGTLGGKKVAVLVPEA